MKILFRTFTFLVILSNLIFAGTTGKISGKIIDAETGEPLLGVSVMLMGTSRGAASDFDGTYYLLNIPPGIYSVKISMVGYTSKIFSEVRIQSDLTTKLDVELSASASELGEDVVVIAKKIIQKDLTSSERTFQSDQIDQLPVRDVSSILSLQAGVTRDASGGIHIRGGRSNEISYLVDGVQVVNPINRSSGINIDDQAIEELKAITGTFNAEYGQALSGVVNIVTKRGSEKFKADARIYVGDYFSTDTENYRVMTNESWMDAAANSFLHGARSLNYDFSQHGITSSEQLNETLESGDKPWHNYDGYLDSYNPSNNYDLQLNLSGPVPGTGNRLSYFVAGRFKKNHGYAKGIRYFMPWGLWSPISDTEHNFDKPDQERVFLNNYEKKSAQAKLFYSSNFLNLSYGFYYDNNYNYNAFGKYVIEGGLHSYSDVYTHILSATMIFSNSTFLDIKGSYYANSYERYAYEDPYDYRYVPTNSGEFTEWMFQPGQNSDILLTGNPNDNAFWGNNAQRKDNTTEYISVQMDLTSQINKNNLVKMGAYARFHDLTQDSYSLQFSQSTYRPIVPDKSSAYHQYYTAKPIEFAGYIQDKIEFEELIINLGVRFDYFDAKGNILTDPKDPQIYSPFLLEHIYSNYDPNLSQEELIEYTVDQRKEFWYQESEAHYQFSPRFGVSFPITAEGVIHFSYGHFFQNPEFQYLFANPNYWVAGAGAQNLVGNPNLDAERTVMYELGLQQQLSESLYLHVTGFYRDIRDWVGTGVPIQHYMGETYYSYTNRDHATAKGLTISTGYNLNSFFVSLDYTFMNAQGTSNNPQDAYNAISSNEAPRVELVDLNWDQTHNLNLVASYNNDGWSGTLIGQFQSGFPYTPSFVVTETVGSGTTTGLRENSERRPSTINFDLRVAKSFKVGMFSIQAILDVRNLLDTRNATSVYSDTGLPDFTLENYQNYSRLLEISSTNEIVKNPGMYSSPRYISLGVRIGYN